MAEKFLSSISLAINLNYLHLVGKANLSILGIYALILFLSIRLSIPEALIPGILEDVLSLTKLCQFASSHRIVSNAQPVYSHIYCLHLKICHCEKQFGHMVTMSIICPSFRPWSSYLHMAS